MNLIKDALLWIIPILRKHHIPFQIAGGLAMQAYGSKRALRDIDIDIPETDFKTIRQDVAPFITFGPDNFKDKNWDLFLMTLNYKGQEIDISGAHHDFAEAYEALKIELTKQFDNTIDYANAKNEFCQAMDKKAFMDFDVNHPFLESNRLLAFIPQLACHEDYASMLQNVEFCKAYGVAYTPEEALVRLQSDMDHWNQYAMAPLMWYEKKTHAYVGRGGLKLFRRDGQKDFETELTYQIKREHWNRGFASEIGMACIDYAATVLHLKNIICFTAKSNLSSLRVMQKLGFVFEEDFIHAGITHKLHRLFIKETP
jgi:RimJ/RimL family protein N-acetyltransferase